MRIQGSTQQQHHDSLDGNAYRLTQADIPSSCAPRSPSSTGRGPVRLVLPAQVFHVPARQLDCPGGPSPKQAAEAVELGLEAPLLATGRPCSNRARMGAGPPA